MANVGYIQESLRCSPPGEDYEIHKDSTNKLLTCLIYLEPEVSDGTFFHESKDDLQVSNTNGKEAQVIFLNQVEDHFIHIKILQMN